MINRRFSRRLAYGLAGSLALYVMLASAAGQAPAWADYLDAEAAMKANDLPRAIPLLAQEAKLGNPVAAYNLGKIYENGGDGVPPDLSQAAAWYKLAANVGSLPTQFNGQALGPDAADLIFAAQLYAQYNLGRLYETGKGVPKDVAAAVQWYERAAQQDLDVAQQHLVRIFRQGEGTVAPNPVESTKWLERLAQGGNVPAMSDLGTAYLQGVGVEKNAKIAHDWYLRAAARGSGDALFNLGLLYQSGYSGEPDFKRAAEYYIRASNAKSGRAMLALGDLNAKGQGLPRSRVQALAWYELAADHGVAEAVAKRDAMTREMASDDVDQANTIAASWQPTPDETPLPEAVPPMPAPPPQPSFLPSDQQSGSQPQVDQSGQPAIPNVLPTPSDTGLPGAAAAPTAAPAPEAPAPETEAPTAPAATDTTGQPVPLQPPAAPPAAATEPVTPAPVAPTPVPASAPAPDAAAQPAAPAPAATEPVAPTAAAPATPAPTPAAPAAAEPTATEPTTNDGGAPALSGTPQPGSKPFGGNATAPSQPKPKPKPAAPAPAPDSAPPDSAPQTITLPLNLPGYGTNP